MNHKKDELAHNLASALVAILLGCIVVICIIVNLPNTKEIDGAVIANVLTGGVTLFAPIAAYYLLNDWKEQHNASIDTDYKKRIIEVIREISPIEIKYRNMLGNYLSYKGNSSFTIPLAINKNETEILLDKINLLINLITELSETIEDTSFQNNLKNIIDHYYNYAQLYPIIFNKVAEITASEFEKDEVIRFLGTELNFIYKEGATKWTSSTFYGYAIDGIRKTELRKFFLKELKIK